MFWLETLMFWIFDICKDVSRIFFFSTLTAVSIINGRPATALGEYIDPWVSYFPLELYKSG